MVAPTVGINALLTRDSSPPTWKRIPAVHSPNEEIDVTEGIEYGGGAHRCSCQQAHKRTRRLHVGGLPCGCRQREGLIMV
jgi:hypothetical protein